MEKSIGSDLKGRTILENAVIMLGRARKAKKAHRMSTQCCRESGRSCSGCHYWSGAISALSELLGLPAAID
jgi:hypothetical protein